jgi:hypothetical protein
LHDEISPAERGEDLSHVGSIQTQLTRNLSTGNGKRCTVGIIYRRDKKDNQQNIIANMCSRLTLRQYSGLGMNAHGDPHFTSTE